MGDFTVTYVDPTSNEWTTKDGKGRFVDYSIQAEGDAGKGAFRLTRKPESPAPTPGEVLEGYEIVHGPHGAKLKREPGGFKPSGNGSGGGGRSAQDTAQIVRQHSQEMALRLLALEIELGTVPRDAKASELLVPRIDWFQRDAEAAKPMGAA